MFLYSSYFIYLLINSLIHVINIIIGFNREVTLSFSIQRLIMVFLINILTVIFIVVLDKLKNYSHSESNKSSSKIIYHARYISLLCDGNYI